jgi:hypothetical protein
LAIIAQTAPYIYRPCVSSFLFSFFQLSALFRYAHFQLTLFTPLKQKIETKPTIPRARSSLKQGGKTKKDFRLSFFSFLFVSQLFFFFFFSLQRLPHFPFPHVRMSANLFSMHEAAFWVSRHWLDPTGCNPMFQALMSVTNLIILFVK